MLSVIEKFKLENKGKLELPQIELRKQFYLSGEKSAKETEDGLELNFIISTATVDRDQDTIAVDGWELENYNKNPVVLWAHDSRRPPVARSLSTWVQDGALKSAAQFMTKDLSSFGHSVGQMYAKGFLNAISVGFRSQEAKWAVDEENRPWGIDYFKQELLEYSCVPVPANPEALIDAKTAGIDMEPMLGWVIECLDTGDGIPQETAEKIYGILQTKSTFVVPKSEIVTPETAGKALSQVERQIQINENRRKYHEF